MAYGASRNAYGQYTLLKSYSIFSSQLPKGTIKNSLKKLYLNNNNNNNSNCILNKQLTPVILQNMK